MTTSETKAPPASTILPMWLRDQRGLVAAFATGYLLLYIAWTYFKWGGEENQALISNIAFLPLSLVATLAAWRVTTTAAFDSRLRLAWFILGCSALTYFLGDLSWFYIESVLAQSPFPSIADFFYLLFYPVALWGLLALPGAPIDRGDRVKFTFDMAIVMTVAWMVVWFFIISPTAASAGGDEDWLVIAISAAYPIADLVVLAGMVWILLRKIDPTLRSALILYLGGLFSFVVADLLFAYGALTGTYESGNWIDVGWVVAYWLLALAALRQQSPVTAESDGNWFVRVFLEWLPLALPFVAIILGYGLVILVSSGQIDLGTSVQGLFVGAGLLTVFVIGRQMLALRDNLRLNAELRAFSAELEKRVEERTRELQQSQEALLASQKLASTGALAAGIAHEVGNPLNTIAAATEALQTHIELGETDAQTLNEYVPVIHRAVWHAARIVQTLRNFSRGSQPELVPQNLDQVLDDALFLMTYQIDRWKNILVDTDYEANLPKVSCDRNQIAQVLINLLNNARDAMPNGGTIKLRLSRAKDQASIEVIDEGQGIAPDQIEKIFAPFFTTKAIGKGSGLGLSIVSGIVRAHSGTLTVHSDGLGKGSTFRVLLPFIEKSSS